MCNMDPVDVSRVHTPVGMDGRCKCQLHEPCAMHTIYFWFKLGATSSEKVVRLLMEPSSMFNVKKRELLQVHVDVVLNDLMISVYMGCSIAMTPMPDSVNQMKLSNREYIGVQLDPEGFNRALGLALSVVERNVPYNYSDILLIPMPFQRFTKSIFDDSDDDLATVTSLYCSQFALLLLKQSLSSVQDPELFAALQSVTSRCMSPDTLYKLLQKHVGVLA
jgi:hypothetical protein